MITGLGERIDEHSENFNEKLENILKKNRTEEYSNWGVKKRKLEKGTTDQVIQRIA